MDIITRITRQRGKMQIVISEQETIVYRFRSSASGR